MSNKIDAKVLQMYQAGCSQSEIKKKLNLPTSRIFGVLHDSGIDTTAYRKIEPTMAHVVDVLLEHHVFYRDIEAYCDISFDVARERVKRSGSTQRGHTRTYSPADDADTMFPGFAHFLRRYNAGESFTALVDALNLTDAQIYAVFYHLWSTGSNQTHAERLRERIQKQLDDGYSLSAAAKRERISPSVVRAYVRSKS